MSSSGNYLFANWAYYRRKGKNEGQILADDYVRNAIIKPSVKKTTQRMNKKVEIEFIKYSSQDLIEKLRRGWNLANANQSQAQIPEAGNWIYHRCPKLTETKGAGSKTARDKRLYNKLAPSQITCIKKSLIAPTTTVPQPSSWRLRKDGNNEVFGKNLKNSSTKLLLWGPHGDTALVTHSPLHQLPTSKPKEIFQIIHVWMAVWNDIISWIFLQRKILMPVVA
jgi:hypothetical protein